eukprot:g4877.t1
MSDVFKRLSSKKSFTGMYAERFAHPGHNEEDHDYVLHNDALFRAHLHQGRTRIGDVKRKNSTHHVLTSEESRHIRHRGNNPPPNDPEGKLHYVYEYYCAYALGATDDISELGTLNYIRFCRETPGLMGRPRPLTRTDLDLIYTKAKNKHDTKLKFSNFLDALSAIAIKKFPGEDQKRAFTLLLAKHVLQNPVLTGKPIRIQKKKKSAKKKKKKKKVDSNIFSRNSPEQSNAVGAAAASKLEPREASPASEPPPSPSPSRSQRNVMNVPLSVGIHIGNRGTNTLEVGIFVDLTCANSKVLFRTLFDQVYPRLYESGKDVAFVLYHFAQPWCSSLAVNEAALAVRQIAPKKYVEFCLRIFDCQDSFVPSEAYGKSRQDVHLEACAIAGEIGIDKSEMMARLRVNEHGENIVGPSMRASCLYAIQNGIRATPTVTVNGLVDFYIFHDWTYGQWLSYLSSFQ